MARLEYVLREAESSEAAHQLLIDGGATGRAHLGTHLCQVTQDPTSRREEERERERERECKQWSPLYVHVCTVDWDIFAGKIHVFRL